MKLYVEQFSGATATAAVLGPLLVLSVATSANAATPTPKPPLVMPLLEVTPLEQMVNLTQTEYCTAMWNVNYWAGGIPFAKTQWRICMGG